MSWKAIDRRKVADEGPGIGAATKDKIRSFFPRYPSKKAAMLPALHVAQDEIGYVSIKAMREIAELLEVPPAAVMDVVSFYTAFWTHPKGEKTLMLCRSLTCELLGGEKIRQHIQNKLHVGEHETTADGRFSFMTEECLAACDFGPCMMVNEKMHKCLTIAEVDRILADPNSDRLDMPRSDLFDAPVKNRAKAGGHHD